MCGILAVFCSTMPRRSKKIIDAARKLQKRGPDNCKSIIRDSGMFFFHRLAINDLTSKGQQPMFLKGAMLMCNGEIYNHKELEKKYDIETNSRSDCEIILHLYHRVGWEKTIEELDGVYAIVLLDGNKLYAARDFLGIRPLYFGYTEENDLTFSSLPEVLDEFAKNIDQFPPATWRYYERKDLGFQFDLRHEQSQKIYPVTLPTNYNRLSKELRELLTASVEKRIHADRPIACLLSGGLDSSIVAAILSNILNIKKVHTYSIGLPGSLDLKYARKVASFLKTNHTEVNFSVDEGLRAIPKVIEHLGSYDITTIRASIPMYLLGKYIRNESKDRVVLSGEGSDELFGGYLYFHNAPSNKKAAEESERLLRDLHNYDVLRADRTISSNGLELRVPFLDKSILSFAQSMPLKYKRPIRIEKSLLRYSFRQYLPDYIIERRKDGMSDGVSSLTKSWSEHIRDFVDTQISDEEYHPHSKHFPSKEAYYYKIIYDKIYKNYKFNHPYWMPKWSGNMNDPSGRLLDAFDEIEM